MTESSNIALAEWNCLKYAQNLDGRQAQLSRGFLRCRPAGWFPGLATAWQPLTLSFGADMKIIEVLPETFCEPGPKQCFGGTVNGEAFGVLVDDASEVVLLDFILPFGSDKSRTVLFEYLARRLFVTLGNSWSGPSRTSIKYDENVKREKINEAGVIRVKVSINNQECTLWFILGPQVVNLIDGLWRRQIRSSNPNGNLAGVVDIEIAQLAIPPQMLNEYIKPGTIIDLEIPLTDQVVLRVGGKPLLNSKLKNVNGKIALETMLQSPAPVTLPEGTERIGINLGSLNIDAATLAEISQAGSVLETGWELSSKVDLVVNSENIAAGLLKVFENRLAVCVT